MTHSLASTKKEIQARRRADCLASRRCAAVAHTCPLPAPYSSSSKMSVARSPPRHRFSWTHWLRKMNQEPGLRAWASKRAASLSHLLPFAGNETLPWGPNPMRPGIAPPRPTPPLQHHLLGFPTPHHHPNSGPPFLHFHRQATLYQLELNPASQTWECAGLSPDLRCPVFVAHSLHHSTVHHSPSAAGCQ